MMLELLQYSFFRNAVIGILILSIAAGVIGTYIVTRRLVSLSGGITHSCFGGLGFGYYLGFNPIVMALIFAVASSLGIEWMSSRQKVREDSAIGLVWALGMAIGILFIFLTPGYAPELNSFLFGNLLTINSSDLWLSGIYTVALILFFGIFNRKIIACAFDSDFATVTGLPVRLFNSIMTVMVAICIVLTIRMVGIMLLISMLTVPVLIAEIRSHSFNRIMTMAIIISATSCLGGIFLGTVIDVPCSSIIVLLQVVIFAIARLYHSFRLRRMMQ